MKQPQTEFYIDARHEILNTENIEMEIYCIENLNTDKVRNLIYQAIGLYVLELQLITQTPEVLQVKYRSELVSATFLDYRLRSYGINFKRDGG